MMVIHISRYHAISAVLIAVFIIGVVRSDNENKLCKHVRRRDHTKVITEPCIEAYKARCGWFSLTYCTFYHKVFCTRIENTTEVSYYAVLECCDGFLEAPNGTCLDLKTLDQSIVAKIKNETAMIKNKDVIVNPEDIPKVTQKYTKDESPSMIGLRKQKEPSKTPSTFDLDLSHGAYAGIICAMVLVLIIIAFIIIAIRKKQIRRSKRNLPETETAMQRVVYHSSPVFKNKHVSSPTHRINTCGEIDMQTNVPVSAISESRKGDTQEGLKDKLLDSDEIDMTKERRSESPSKRQQYIDVTEKKGSAEERDDVTVRLLDGASGHSKHEASHDSTEDLRQRLHHSTETNI